MRFFYGLKVGQITEHWIDYVCWKGPDRSVICAQPIAPPERVVPPLAAGNISHTRRRTRADGQLHALRGVALGIFGAQGVSTHWTDPRLHAPQLPVASLKIGGREYLLFSYGIQLGTFRRESRRISA